MGFLQIPVNCSVEKLVNVMLEKGEGAVRIAESYRAEAKDIDTLTALAKRRLKLLRLDQDPSVSPSDYLTCLRRLVNVPPEVKHLFSDCKIRIAHEYGVDEAGWLNIAKDFSL